MTTSETPRIDLLTLASAPMPTLVEALRAAAKQFDDDPARVDQVAEVILAEAIRLIRLGTRRDVADGAVLTTELIVEPRVARLRELRPAAHRSLSAAAKTLNAASSPASKGGELAVLRSWAGNAKRLVGLVSGADGGSLPRATVRRLLDVDESYLSHLLSDLEAAGLVERVKAGRRVTVHLGPIGRQPHVQELVCSAGEAPASRTDRAALRALVERYVRGAFEPQRELARTGRNLTLLAFERRAKRLANQAYGDLRVAIEKTIVDGDEAVCRFQLQGALKSWSGPHPFKLDQVIAVGASEGEIASVEWWSPPDSWPQQETVVVSPLYEAYRIEMGTVEVKLDHPNVREPKLSEVPLPSEAIQPRNDELAPTAEPRMAASGGTRLLPIE